MMPTASHSMIVHGCYNDVQGTQLRWCTYECVMCMCVSFSRVRAFVCSFSYIDGVRVGDHELDVGWTRFARNRSYATYDLPTHLFGPGKHALGLMIGAGFCGEPAAQPDGNAHRAALLSLRLYVGAVDTPPQTIQLIGVTARDPPLTLLALARARAHTHTHTHAHAHAHAHTHTQVQ